MQGIRNFWNGGLVGKFVLIGAGAMSLFGVCCVALLVFAFVTPTSTTNTAPSALTSVSVADAVTVAALIVPEPTILPPTSTLEPTALPTTAPSATPVPTAVPTLPPTPTDTPPLPTESPKLTIEERQAVVDMGAHISAIGQALGKIGELAQNMQNTDVWRLQMAAAIFLVQTEHAALMKMDVPAKIKPLHGAVVIATTDCNAAMDKIISGLDTSKVSDIQAGAVLMVSCGQKIKDAQPDLDALRAQL